MNRSEPLGTVGYKKEQIISFSSNGELIIKVSIGKVLAELLKDKEVIENKTIAAGDKGHVFRIPPNESFQKYKVKITGLTNIDNKFQISGNAGNATVHDNDNLSLM